MTKKNNKKEIDIIQSIAKEYNLNQDYFKIWSNNMAYILGLWYAKGHIYNSKMFDITLRAKDKYLLKQIAKELEYEDDLTNPVNRQVVRLNFNCAIIYDDIVKLCGTELHFPSIPKEYLPDFIRGYFDGKGSVHDIKGKRVNIRFICTSKSFLKDLLHILRVEANVKGGSFYEFNYSLRFGEKDSMKIFNYMYRNTSDELFLRRKKNRFLKYVK